MKRNQKTAMLVLMVAMLCLCAAAAAQAQGLTEETAVIQPEPVYRAYASVAETSLSRAAGKKPRCIYLTPQGKVFNQTMVEEFAQEEELIFL